MHILCKVLYLAAASVVLNGCSGNTEPDYAVQQSENEFLTSYTWLLREMQATSVAYDFSSQYTTPASEISVVFNDSEQENGKGALYTEGLCSEGRTNYLMSYENETSRIHVSGIPLMTDSICGSIDDGYAQAYYYFFNEFFESEYLVVMSVSQRHLLLNNQNGSRFEFVNSEQP